MIRLLLFRCERQFPQSRRRALENAGIQIKAAESNESALKLLRAWPIDILMIGQQVPLHDRNKLSLAAKSLHKLRVIFLYRGSISHAESADALLSAEISTEDLVSAIRRLVGLSTEDAGLSRSAV
jgi:DNA-binding NtrC family response regulator